ncbi:MAG: hypothetical protein NTY46_16155 [Candidatus Sumerlaeota bacterium]|nr:hypothetical protein [Candidatus Sumerlaeota bacterium]
MNEHRFDIRAVMPVVALGCAWGVVESFAGVSLRGSCARMFTGSLLTGASIFFFAAASGYGLRLIMLSVLPLIAGSLRIYTGFLLDQKIMSGAVANPVFAFWMECAAFMLVFFVARKCLSRGLTAGMTMGAFTAILAAVLFLPVKVFTGIPACVVPGGSTPLAVWGMPVGAVMGAVMMPFGLWAGRCLRNASATTSRRRCWMALACETAVSVLCVVVLTLVYV